MFYCHIFFAFSQEYKQALNEALVWKIQMLADINRTLVHNASPLEESNVYVREEAVLLQEDRKLALDAVADYAASKIDKQQFLRTFYTASDQEDQKATRMTLFASGVKSRISTPLQNSIAATQKQVADTYMEVLGHALALQVYFKDSYYYDLAFYMVLFKGPQTDLAQPTQYSTGSQELWHAWSRDMPIDEFLVTKARSTIQDNLNGYFQPIIEVREQF